MPSSPRAGRRLPERASRSSPEAALRAAARLAWWAAAGAGLLVIGGAATWQLQRSEYFWRNPLEGATVTRLTDFEGAEHHAAISRDGKFVAFLSDRDGTWDAWATQVGTGDVHNLTKGSVRGAAESGDPHCWLSSGRVAGHPLESRAGFHQGRSGRCRVGGSDDGRPASALPARHLRARLVARRQTHRVPPANGRRSLFVTELDEKSGRQIYVARPGFHNHFPVWSHDGAFIYFVHGLVHGPLDESDVWRIRPTGGEPERLTFHDSRVTFPTLLGNRTLLYLATDDEGSGPWIYAMDVERRVPHRISTGVEEYMSLAASADGRRLVATVSRSTAGLWRVPIADRVIDESGATPISLPTARGLSPRAGRGYIIYRAPKAGTDGLVKLVGRHVD